MNLRVRVVTPDEAQAPVAIEERIQRPIRREAERAAEVSILDQRQLGLRGPEDMVAVSDCGKRGDNRSKVTSPDSPPSWAWR
jgi:hypothetical protein